MFERYTEHARRVIFFARYEASQVGSPFIETEHMLLGIMRQNRDLIRAVLPKTSTETIRKHIGDRQNRSEKTSVSVDLPLSNECKRVLAYAAEEAERLSHRHIGSEHLLLGLLREKEGLAAQILRSYGATIESTRKIISTRKQAVERYEEAVYIHGEPWNSGYVQSEMEELRKFAWRKRDWKPQDILIESSTGRIHFDVSQQDDPALKLVPGGLSRELCSLCHWELKLGDGPEHATGYTNGREWLCTECYETWIASPK